MTHVFDDEIEFQGYTVAILAQRNVPPSVLADFTHGLNNATLFEAALVEIAQDERKDQQAEETLELLHTAFKRIEKNGLLRWADVQTVVQKFVQGELE